MTSDPASLGSRFDAQGRLQDAADEGAPGGSPTSEQATSAAETSQAEGDEADGTTGTDDVAGGQDAQSDEIPNTSTGVGIGASSEPSTFEPEEDPADEAH